MREFLIGIAIAASIAAAFYLLPDTQADYHHGYPRIPIQVYNEFTKWKKEHNILYGSYREESLRAQIFYQNWLKIEKHNADNSQTYTLGVTPFMDLTQKEFESMYLKLITPEKLEVAKVQEKPSNRPDKFDWRDTAGVIRQVKNQGSCGSCWAFSATGALEGIAKIKQGKDDEFSEQQLVDCSKSYGNHGCGGGLMTYAFQYVRDKGITTEQDYPYVGKDQTCKKDGGAFKISGFQNLPTGDLETLANTVCSQPVSIASDASNWSLYKGGIFSNCGTRLNHGILMVGYDPDAWHVKNSWGKTWGESGYIRLKRGNTCGCANMSTIPLI